MIGRTRHGKKESITTGNDVYIRTQNIDRSGQIEIGSDVVISERVTILRHEHIFTRRVIRPVAGPKPIITSEKLTIRDHVYIGEGAYILPQVTEIPEGCIIGVAAVLTRNPTGPNQVWAGNPARLIRELEE